MSERASAIVCACWDSFGQGYTAAVLPPVDCGTSIRVALFCSQIAGVIAQRFDAVSLPSWRLPEIFDASPGLNVDDWRCVAPFDAGPRNQYPNSQTVSGFAEAFLCLFPRLVPGPVAFVRPIRPLGCQKVGLHSWVLQRVLPGVLAAELLGPETT